MSEVRCFNQQTEPELLSSTRRTTSYWLVSIVHILVISNREHALSQSTQENIIMRVLPPKPLYATEGYAASLNNGCGVQCS